MTTTTTTTTTTIYFVSGHLDLTADEFATHYAPRLRDAIATGGAFVVGDARGCDAMAQAYLHAAGATLTVFHMFTTPRNCPPGVPCEGGFASDAERDHALTARSHADIAWVRPGRERSGTARNLARRAALALAT